LAVAASAVATTFEFGLEIRDQLIEQTVQLQYDV